MARTILSDERKIELEDVNIGNMIIFCEGATEENYIKYFTDIIEKKANKFNNIEIKTENTRGNSRRVLNYADEFLSEENNNRKYTNYKKSLVFDCDSPKPNDSDNIKNVISDMRASANKYEILASNFSFEIWLLMHFEDVNCENAITKKLMYENLQKHLGMDNYKKANKGIIRQIINNDNIENAIKNAERLLNEYKNQDKSINDIIDEKKPYTKVHVLILEFMKCISV